MKSKATFMKKDLVVVLGCIVFLLANIGAIGPRGRQRAKEAVCLSNLRKWGLIFQMYAQDNNGSTIGGSEFWVTKLYPYHKSIKLMDKQK